MNTLADLGKEFGFAATIYPEQVLRGHHVSSTEIRKLVGEGKMAKARALLGRPFSIVSNPGRGRGYGHKYTVPTVNLARYDELVPAIGVYITWLRVGSECFEAVTNVGNRPTFGADSFAIESHLLNFHPIELLPRDGVGTGFPAPAAARDQVPIGGSAARADRQRRAQGAPLFSAAEGGKRIAAVCALEPKPDSFCHYT